MQNFQERLKQVRESKGLSKSEISIALNIHPQTWHKYENGISKMNLETLKKFCHTLNVSADYMLGLSNNMTLTKPQESQTAVMITAEVLSHEIAHYTEKRQQGNPEGFYEVE